MRKTMTVCLVSALVLGAFVGAADAGKRKKKKPLIRTVTAPYDLPAPGIPGLFRGGNCGSPNTGCAVFTTVGKEKYASIKIADTSGQPVYADITVGDGTSSTLLASVCGETEEPLQVGGGVTLTVWVQAPPNPTVCPLSGSAGSVTATLSNRT